MIDHYYDKLFSVARPPAAIVQNPYLEKAAANSAAPLVDVRRMSFIVFQPELFFSFRSLIAIVVPCGRSRLNLHAPAKSQSRN